MKRNYLIYGILVFLALFIYVDVSGQEQPTRRNRAEMYFNKLEYANAAGAYERLVDTKRPRVVDMEKLAESYLRINRYDLAENWYARVVGEKEASQAAHLNYAKALKQRGKYAEAKRQYEIYMSKYGRSETIEREIQGADSAIVWMENPLPYQLRNEETINTARAEFSTALYGDGLLYTAEPSTSISKRSGMTGESYLRVYSAHTDAQGHLRDAALYGQSVNNASYHVGPVASNEAGDVLYVTRTYDGKDTERFSDNNVKWRKQNLELKVYRQSGDSWEEEDFPYNDVQRYSLGHAALSTDGTLLYYASDMPGGYGGVDIWYSELQPDGSWGRPQNAGSAINTGGDEMFPSIYGETLYFSSNGHVGMGGLDIFRANGAKSNFGTPKNLEYPVNSASDDFAFLIVQEDKDSKQGYLSSNRVGGQGSDDIYSFHYARPPIRIILEGITRSKTTGDILAESTVTLFGPNGQIIAKKLSDDRAFFTFDIDADTHYRLYGEKESYFPDWLSVGPIQASKDTVVRVALNLQPVFTVGDKFVLENIYYDFDKHNIRADAALILDKLVATMRDNPSLKIELSSHTDSRGTHRYNEALSQRRAQSAVEYLVSRGISRDRLVAKGYGETRLVNHCSDGVSCSPAQHQANRRTEVEILAF